MDRDPLEAARPDPLITVEAAPPDAGEDAGWIRGRRAAEFRAPSRLVVAPGECPHRVRVRDLQGPTQIAFVLAAVPVFGSALMSLGSLLFGGVMVGMGVDGPDATMIVVGAVMAFLAAVLLFGAVVCVRVWRGLHRPGLAVCVSSTAAPPLILVFVALLAFGGGQPWLMLLVAPPVGPMIVLWYFRAVLHPRETCADYPWLPSDLLRMTGIGRR
ncbi:hypothetical protein [Glycomyces sp. NPDC048151]|uniref:hypothetical protein n=1 Tax=Glycomyces sp. NPDC048151 TaxID=3364002 RepID=UPI0037206A47